MSDRASELHQAIMNLPCHGPHGDVLGLYKRGHRDARHAAAELVLTTTAASGEGERLKQCDEYEATLAAIENTFGCSRSRVVDIARDVMNRANDLDRLRRDVEGMAKRLDSELSKQPLSFARLEADNARLTTALREAQQRAERLERELAELRLSHEACKLLCLKTAKERNALREGARHVVGGTDSGCMASTDLSVPSVGHGIRLLRAALQPAAAAAAAASEPIVVAGRTCQFLQNADGQWRVEDCNGTELLEDGRWSDTGLRS